jgi:hypothetical protein
MTGREVFMANLIEDRVTVEFVNGEVYEVTSNDPSRISEMTLEDYRHATKTGAQILSSVVCRPHPDGNCYYYIGTRKVKCTCP